MLNLYDLYNEIHTFSLYYKLYYYLFSNLLENWIERLKRTRVFFYIKYATSSLIIKVQLLKNCEYSNDLGKLKV